MKPIKTHQAWFILLTFTITFSSYAQTPQLSLTEITEQFCEDLSKKLRTVKHQDCLALKLHASVKHQSVKQRPLTYKEVVPKPNTPPPKGRILFIGGIHGDEYAAISLTYIWLKTLLQPSTPTSYHWLFLPLANPDGLFRSPATRTNANSVDLNRNFPSPDWPKLALKTWQSHTGANPRRFPGETANSEPETQWLVQLIERFQPDAIISLHAPYGLLDYDGPEHALPNKIGHLRHRALGTYPGSLGRYAGEYLNIPVLTLELRSAGTMPSSQEIQHMLKDIETWVETKIGAGLAALN